METVRIALAFFLGVTRNLVDWRSLDIDGNTSEDICMYVCGSWRYRGSGSEKSEWA